MHPVVARRLEPRRLIGRTPAVEHARRCAELPHPPVRVHPAAAVEPIQTWDSLDQRETLPAFFPALPLPLSGLCEPLLLFLPA